MLPILIAAILTGPYETAELKWRADRETSLKSARGWLSVAGLTWLKEGTSTLGSDPASDVVLPSYTPKSYGKLVRSGKTITLQIPGQPDEAIKLESSQIKVQDAVFTVIERGARIGVRLYDPHSKAQKEFKGLKWFPIDEKYRVTAKFIPYDKVKTLKITNVIGDVSDMPSPGVVSFQIKGKTYQLPAQDEGDGFFYNFQDATSGRETYGAGRFLYSEKPKDGVVILDFNRATNPPCAYTNFATCPLPPKDSRLSIPIKAGELVHHPAH